MFKRIRSWVSKMFKNIGRRVLKVGEQLAEPKSPTTREPIAVPEPLKPNGPILDVQSINWEKLSEEPISEIKDAINNGSYYGIDKTEFINDLLDFAYYVKNDDKCKDFCNRYNHDWDCYDEALKIKEAVINTDWEKYITWRQNGQGYEIDKAIKDSDHLSYNHMFTEGELGDYGPEYVDNAVDLIKRVANNLILSE